MKATVRNLNIGLVHCLEPLLKPKVQMNFSFFKWKLPYFKNDVLVKIKYTLALKQFNIQPKEYYPLYLLSIKGNVHTSVVVLIGLLNARSKNRKLYLEITSNTFSTIMSNNAFTNN